MFATLTPLIVIFLVLLVAFSILRNGLRIVPQQQAWVVERLGRFHRVLGPGLNLLIPFTDRIVVCASCIAAFIGLDDPYAAFTGSVICKYRNPSTVKVVLSSEMQTCGGTSVGTSRVSNR